MSPVTSTIVHHGIRKLLLLCRHQAGLLADFGMVRLCTSYPHLNCKNSKATTDDADKTVSNAAEADGGTETVFSDAEAETKFLTNDQSTTKHVAVLLGYCGKGYFGMQSFNRKRFRKTVERDFLCALAKAGVISEDESLRPFKIGFQAGASRTDRSVSASRQLVTFRTCLEKSAFQDVVVKTNLHLPPEVRIFGCREVTKSFNCWKWCDYRTYCYVMPTYAFAPVDELTREDYRIPESLVNEINDTLSNFKGTHSFYNFTSGLEPDQQSCLRVIKEFQCGKPFIQDGIEFVLLTVKGRSFVLHQIRKMIGLTVAIVRGLTPLDTLSKAWLPNRLHLPTAPGLGLYLEDLHYDSYSKNFAKPGSFDVLLWDDYEDAINKFKENIILATIVNTEKKEKPMLKWLELLLYHQFEPLDAAREQVNRLILLHLSLLDDKRNGLQDVNTAELRLFNDGGTVHLYSRPSKVGFNQKTECGDDESIHQSCSDNTQVPVTKKPRAELRPEDSTVALLLGYCGQGYYGMQRGRFLKTVERELLSALEKANVISAEDSSHTGNIRFHRASRTDKGVSACRQLVSFRANLKKWTFTDLVETANVHLPPEVRIFGCKKVTQSFSCWKMCDSRTYSYMLPSFAFASVEELTTEDYRVSASTLNDVNTIMSKFVGTHSFYNFTSKWDPDKLLCRRTVTEFKCSQPFICDGLEFVNISIKGKSFLLHQIRKMIGLTIAIARSLATTDTIAKAWLPSRVHLPIAPGLGLFLEDLHYETYNKHFAGEFNRDFLTWDEYQNQVTKFKEDFIIPVIVNTEKREKLMLNWLGVLLYHTYEDPATEDIVGLRMYRDALLNNKNFNR